MKSLKHYWLFLFTWVLLAVYSFTRRDLNLILYNIFPYSNFIYNTRNWLTNLGYYQRPLAALIFLILSLIIFWLYLKLIHQPLPRSTTWLKWLIPLSAIGIVSYPMFSYDIFNYIFNAKMVLIYQVNPHLQTASQFPRDLMLRFMHNVHTPAPYAYGWTAASLLPGLAWFTSKFVASFWAMKAFVTFFWLGELWILQKLVNKLFPNQPHRWWIFALSPLVLVETLMVGHNDVVMMFPALLSFWYLIKSKKLFDRSWLISIFLLLLSASIKYATIIILPLYFLNLHNLQGSTLKPKKVDIAGIAAILLLLVMFTRPGQLHSWYLIWSFSFAVLSKSRRLVAIFTALSLGALLRYLPYIYFGHWDPPVYLYQNLIWVLALIFLPGFFRKMIK